VSQVNPIGDDDAIERVLAGLRATEVPKGLERRIVAGLQARNVEARPGWATWRWVAGFGMAGALAVLLLSAMAGRGHGDASPQVPIAAAVAPTSARTMAVTVPVATIGPRRGRRRGNSAVSAAMADVDENERLARTEMMAPSLPEPEQPLTAQERLMVQMARQGDQDEVARLEPALTPQDRAEAEKIVAGLSKSLFAGLTMGENE
jgi:hypothetical protein